MPKITWTPNLSVNVEQFDAQHRRLIEMINELDDAMTKGKGKEVLGKTLAGLVLYTQTHFAGEERLLATHGYEGLSKHRAEHQELIRQVADIQKEFGAGRIGLTIPTMKFLGDWLMHHIMGTDKQYGAFLNAKGIK